MKPVFQTVIDEVKGNCLVACIASILELDIEDVPDFREKDVWYNQYQNWFRMNSYEFQVTSEEPKEKYYIAQYPSCVFKGKSHVVVASEGKIVHDPNPNSKVSGKPDKYYLIYEV
jgi:hypothetical protein